MNFRGKENKSNKGDYDRFFKKKDEKKVEKKIFNIQEQHFPILLHQNQDVSQLNPCINNLNNDTNNINDSKSFASMVSISKNVPVMLEEVVKPGCVSMQYDKKTRKIIVRYGEKTRSMIEYEKKEKIRNSLHYRMSKAVEQINKNRENYIKYYDEVHGEGAYEEKFVYKNEFSDDDEESDDDIDDYDSN